MSILAVNNISYNYKNSKKSVPFVKFNSVAPAHNKLQMDTISFKGLPKIGEKTIEKVVHAEFPEVKSIMLRIMQKFNEETAFIKEVIGHECVDRSKLTKDLPDFRNFVSKGWECYPDFLKKSGRLFSVNETGNIIKLFRKNELGEEILTTKITYDAKPPMHDDYVIRVQKYLNGDLIQETGLNKYRHIVTSEFAKDGSLMNTAEGSLGYNFHSIDAYKYGEGKYGRVSKKFSMIKPDGFHEKPMYFLEKYDTKRGEFLGSMAFREDGTLQFEILKNAHTGKDIVKAYETDGKTLKNADSFCSQV